jgi:hypothetical protein
MCIHNHQPIHLRVICFKEFASTLTNQAFKARFPILIIKSTRPSPRKRPSIMQQNVFQSSNHAADFPALLTSLIQSSSPTQESKPPWTTRQISCALCAPRSFPSRELRYATPARTSSASPSKTRTSQRRVALSSERQPVNMLWKRSRR